LIKVVSHNNKDDDLLDVDLTKKIAGRSVLQKLTYNHIYFVFVKSTRMM